MTYSLRILVVFVAMIAGAAFSAEIAETEQRPAMSSALSGAGAWREQGSRAGSTRPWRIHMVRNVEGEVRAKISLPGLPDLDGAQIEAQVIGRDAFGVLLDEKGTQIATFNATVWKGGTGGSFIMGDGRSGTWEYDAGTKAEVLRLEPVTSDAPATTTADQ